MLVIKMIKENTTIIFSIVWLVFFLFFSIMAFQSCQSISIELPRYVYKAPKGQTIGDLLKAMENMSKTHNEAVDQLEKSIRSEAKTMAAINGISAFLCLLGLSAQIADYRQNKKDK